MLSPPSLSAVYRWWPTSEIVSVLHIANPDSLLHILASFLLYIIHFAIIPPYTLYPVSILPYILCSNSVQPYITHSSSILPHMFRSVSLLLKNPHTQKMNNCLS